MTDHSFIVFRKFLASALCGVFFIANCALAHSTEANFWSSRRAASQRVVVDDETVDTVGSPSQTLLDQLPKAGPLDLGGGHSALFSKNLDSGKVAFSVGAKTGDWVGKLVSPYGSVREVYLSPNSKAPFIVNIQDGHGIEEVQRNISSMIGLLGQEPGIHLVGLEAAWGSFSLEPYRDYPDPAITKEIAELFLKKGLIAGPEYAGLTLPKSPNFFGMEDKALYDANLQALKTAYKGKEAAQQTVAGLRHEASKLKEAHYSENLKSFDRHFEAYNSEKENLGVYARYLLKTGTSQVPHPALSQEEREIHRYPNLTLLVQAVDEEDKLDFNQVENERKELVEKLVGKLSTTEMENLLAKSVDYKAGRVGYTDYHTHLKSICSSHGIQLAQWAQLNRYIAYVILADKIDKNGLMNEMDDLDRTIPDSLARTVEEKKLVAIDYDLSLLAKLTRLEMRMADWVAYGKRAEVSHLAARLAELDPAVEVKGLSAETLKPFEEFCSYAAQRNIAMTDNLLRQIADSKSKSAVLVAGGFHTEGLSALLRQKQISYVVVSPKITEEPKDNNYMDILANDPVPLEKQLAGDRIYLPKTVPMTEPTEKLSRLTIAIQKVRQTGAVISEWVDGLSVTSDKNRREVVAELFESVYVVKDSPKVALLNFFSNPGEKILSFASSLISLVKNFMDFVPLGRLTPAYAVGTSQSTPFAAATGAGVQLLQSWRQEWAIAVRESLLFLNPVYFFFRHDWKGGAQKTIGALLILGLVLVMGETAELVMSGFAHFGLEQSIHTTLMAYFTGWTATIPAHTTWNFLIERVNLSLKDRGIRFQFPRLTIPSVSGKSQIDLMADAFLATYQRWQKGALMDEDLKVEILKLTEQSNLPFPVTQIINRIALKDEDQLIDIFRSPKSFLFVANQSVDYAVQHLESFERGRVSFDEFIEAFESAITNFSYPLIQDTRDLNPGTGGLSFIYGGKVNGQEAILKWEKNRDGLKERVAVVTDLEPFGGAKYLGLFRVVDPRGVWRTAIGLERIEGQSVLGLFRMMKDGEPFPFAITDAHLNGLNALAKSLTDQGKHLTEVNAGDIMLTTNAQRAVVPLDMGVQDGVTPDAGLVAPGFSVSKVDGSVIAEGVEAPMANLIQALVSYTASGNVAGSQGMTDDPDNGDDKPSVDLGKGIDRICDQLVEEYGEDYIFLVHQTNADTAKKLVDETSTVFGQNGLNGTASVANQGTLREGMRAVAGLESSATRHKGSSGLLVMAVPKKWKDLMKGKFTLPGLDDFLMDQTESDPSFINPNGGFGLPHKYIVGMFTNDGFQENPNFVGRSGSVSPVFTTHDTREAGRARLFKFLGWKTAPTSPVLNWIINRGVEVFFAPFAEREASRDSIGWFKDHKFSGIQYAFAVLGLAFIVGAVPILAAGGIFFGLDIPFVTKVLAFAFFGAGYWKFRDIGMIVPHMVWNVFGFFVPVFTLGQNAVNEIRNIKTTLLNVKPFFERQTGSRGELTDAELGETTKAVSAFNGAMIRLQALNDDIAAGRIDRVQQNEVGAVFDSIRRERLIVGALPFSDAIKSIASADGHVTAFAYLDKIAEFKSFYSPDDLAIIKATERAINKIYLKTKASEGKKISALFVKNSGKEIRLTKQEMEWLEIFSQMESINSFVPSFQLMAVYGKKKPKYYENIWEDGLKELLSDYWSGSVVDREADSELPSEMARLYAEMPQYFTTMEEAITEYPTIESVNESIALDLRQPAKLIALLNKKTQKDYEKALIIHFESIPTEIKVVDPNTRENFTVLAHPKVFGNRKVEMTAAKLRDLAVRFFSKEEFRDVGHRKVGIQVIKGDLYAYARKSLDSNTLVIYWIGMSQKAHATVSTGANDDVNQDVLTAFKAIKEGEVIPVPFYSWKGRLHLGRPAAATIPAVEGFIRAMLNWRVKTFPHSKWANQWKSLDSNGQTDRIIRVYAPFVESFGLGVAYWGLNALAPAVLSVLGFDPGLWFGNRLDVGLFAALNIIFGALHTDVYRPGSKPGEWTKGKATKLERLGIMTTALFIHSPLLFSILNPLLSPFLFVAGNLLASLLTVLLHRLYNDVIVASTLGRKMKLLPLAIGGEGTQRRSKRPKPVRDDQMMRIIAWLGNKEPLFERVHLELMATFDEYAEFIKNQMSQLGPGQTINSRFLISVWMYWSTHSIGIAKDVPDEFMAELRKLGKINIDGAGESINVSRLSEVRVVDRPDGEKWALKWTKFGDRPLTLSKAIGRIVSLFSEEKQLEELNSQTTHPLVPKIKKSWVVRGRSVLATEWIPGKHPGAGNTNLTIEEAVRILRAVRDFHAFGKVHGDLKPANIVLVESGAVLIDLGATKNIYDYGVFNELQPSPKYAAPDIANGTSQGTDIYAVARLLVDLLPDYLVMDRRIFPLLERSIMKFDAPADVIQSGIPLTSFRPTAQELLTAFEEVLKTNPERRAITMTERDRLDRLLVHMTTVLNYLQATIFQQPGANAWKDDSTDSTAGSSPIRGAVGAVWVGPFNWALGKYPGLKNYTNGLFALAGVLESFVIVGIFSAVPGTEAVAVAFMTWAGIWGVTQFGHRKVLVFNDATEKFEAVTSTGSVARTATMIAFSSLFPAILFNTLLSMETTVALAIFNTITGAALHGGLNFKGISVSRHDPVKTVLNSVQKSIDTLTKPFAGKLAFYGAIMPAIETGLLVLLRAHLMAMGMDPTGGFFLIFSGLLFASVHTIARTLLYGKADPRSKVTAVEFLSWTLGGALFMDLLGGLNGWVASFGVHGVLNALLIGLKSNRRIGQFTPIWIKEIPLFSVLPNSIKKLERNKERPRFFGSDIFSDFKNNPPALAGAIVDGYQNGRLQSFRHFFSEETLFVAAQENLDRIAQTIVADKIKRATFHPIRNQIGKHMDVYEATTIPGLIVKSPRPEYTFGNVPRYDKQELNLIKSGYRVAKEQLGGLFAVMLLEGTTINVNGNEITPPFIIIQEKVTPLAAIFKNIKRRAEKNPENKDELQRIEKDIELNLDGVLSEMWTRGVVDIDFYNTSNNYGITSSGKIVGFDVDRVMRIEDYLRSDPNPSITDLQTRRTRILSSWQEGKQKKVKGVRVHDIFEQDVRAAQETWIVDHFNEYFLSDNKEKHTTTIDIANNFGYGILRLFFSHALAAKWGMRLLPVEIGGILFAGWMTPSWVDALTPSLIGMDPMGMSVAGMLIGLALFKLLHYALQYLQFFMGRGEKPVVSLASFGREYFYFLPYVALPFLAHSAVLFAAWAIVAGYLHYSYDAKLLKDTKQTLPDSGDGKTTGVPETDSGQNASDQLAREAVLRLMGPLFKLPKNLKARGGSFDYGAKLFSEVPRSAIEAAMLNLNSPGAPTDAAQNVGRIIAEANGPGARITLNFVGFDTWEQKVKTVALDLLAGLLIANQPVLIVSELSDETEMREKFVVPLDKTGLPQFINNANETTTMANVVEQYGDKGIPLSSTVITPKGTETIFTAGMKDRFKFLILETLATSINQQIQGLLAALRAA